MSELPFLILPTVDYKDSFLQALREFHAEGRGLLWGEKRLQRNFEEFVQARLRQRTNPDPGRVPETRYWLIHHHEYIGSVSIRHELDNYLLQIGGHIGYEIRPSKRNRGYGTLICRLGIEKARSEIGLGRLLITCDDDNIPSAKIIETNGGVLENITHNNDHVVPKRRYWVEVDTDQHR